MSTADPTTNLANLVIALLTPMFLWATEGDIHFARIAAAQTLNEYRVANRLSLFTAAKIIAFDIATLSSLSQSMYEDVSISLALRLRGNANSLDRSGDRNRCTLQAESRHVPAAARDTLEDQIAQAQQMVRTAKARVQAACSPAPAPAADKTPPAAAPEAAPAAVEQPRAAWPEAMTAVADAFATDIDALPPGQRWGEMARIMALAAAAADSATDTPAVPAMAAE